MVYCVEDLGRGIRAGAGLRGRRQDRLPLAAPIPGGGSIRPSGPLVQAPMSAPADAEANGSANRGLATATLDPGPGWRTRPGLPGHGRPHPAPTGSQPAPCPGADGTTRRYQHERAGDLLHLDIKRLGRFDRPGHRVTGNRTQDSPGPAGSTCTSPSTTAPASPIRRCTPTSGLHRPS